MAGTTARLKNKNGIYGINVPGHLMLPGVIIEDTYKWIRNQISEMFGHTAWFQEPMRNDHQNQLFKPFM